MRAFVLAVIIASVPVSSAAAPEPQFPEANKACRPLPVRESPDEAAPVVFELPEGTRIKMGNRKVVEKTTWFNIRTKDGKIGWADGSLLCEGAPGVESQLPPAIPTDAAGKVEYREVVEVEGAATDELFLRAKAWCATTPTGSEPATKMAGSDYMVGGGPTRSAVADSLGIRTAEPDLGLITMLGMTVSQAATGSFFRPWKVTHKLTIEVKDGKYRVTVADLQLVNPEMAGTPMPIEEVIKHQVNWKFANRLDASIVAMMADLKGAMTTPVGARKDGW